jgi:hypothetical protein
MRARRRWWGVRVDGSDEGVDSKEVLIKPCGLWMFWPLGVETLGQWGRVDRSLDCSGRELRCHCNSGLDERAKIRFN